MSQISLPWQRGSIRGKCDLQHSTAHPRKPLYGRKNLVHKPSYSPFCPKFRCHGNRGRSGENAIGSIQWPITENPPIGAKISYCQRPGPGWRGSRDGIRTVEAGYLAVAHQTVTNCRAEQSLWDDTGSFGLMFCCK